MNYLIHQKQFLAVEEKITSLNIQFFIPKGLKIGVSSLMKVRRKPLV